MRTNTNWQGFESGIAQLLLAADVRYQTADVSVFCNYALSCDLKVTNGLTKNHLHCKLIKPKDTLLSVSQMSWIVLHFQMFFKHQTSMWLLICIMTAACLPIIQFYHCDPEGQRNNNNIPHMLAVSAVQTFI